MGDHLLVGGIRYSGVIDLWGDKYIARGTMWLRVNGPPTSGAHLPRDRSVYDILSTNRGGSINTSI